MYRGHLLIGLLAIFVFGCAGGNSQKTSARAEEHTGLSRSTVPNSINTEPGFDADLFHYSHQGSGFFPWVIVKSLTDSETGQPYLNNLERFGLVPGEKSEQNPYGLPVGIVINTLKVQNKDLRMFGFTCAACHTSDVQYKGKSVRIEGASGLFSVDALGDAIAVSLKKTISDKDELIAFLKRLTSEMDEQERELFYGLEVVVKPGRTCRAVCQAVA